MRKLCADQRRIVELEVQLLSERNRAKALYDELKLQVGRAVKAEMRLEKIARPSETITITLH